MHDEIQDFLGAHRGQVKPKTYEAFERHLEQFSEWLRERDLHPHDVTQRDLKKYIGYLSQEKGYAPKTSRSKFVPIRTYYKDEVAEEYIDESPARNIESSDVAKDRTLIEDSWKDERVFLSQEQIQKLVDNVPNPQIRNRCIILFQYHTGLRRNEVAKTKLEKMDREERKVTVIGKHDKKITAYWEPTLDPLLDTWIDKYRVQSTHAASSPYLFLTNRSEKISGAQVNKIIKQSAENAGIQNVLFTDAKGHKRHSVTSHAVRHSFGAHWIEKGGSTAALHERFAHTDQQTTEIYKHAVDSWVREESEKVGIGNDINFSDGVEFSQN